MIMWTIRGQVGQVSPMAAGLTCSVLLRELILLEPRTLITLVPSPVLPISLDVDYYNSSPYILYIDLANLFKHRKSNLNFEAELQEIIRIHKNQVKNLFKYQQI